MRGPGRKCEKKFQIVQAPQIVDGGPGSGGFPPGHWCRPRLMRMCSTVTPLVHPFHANSVVRIATRREVGV
jgi:hypothetical protein